MNAIYDAYQTYPDGTNYPVSVGFLSLGAPKLTHSVVDYTYTFNLLAGWLYSKGGVNKLPSYSYGMHVGSVNPDIPGSLILGGYDRNRVLGNVSSQNVDTANGQGKLSIVLQDIGIGVAAGGSPFGYTSKTGLLRQGSSGTSRWQTVEIDATKPYLYLPPSTCDAIATELPVTFNESLGLYFWDTPDARFKDITSSPAYLSFTFEKVSVNSQNITINVPFQQLKLTLQEPLVQQNTTYFPCFQSADSYILGRAFLQAAFIGANWGEGSGNGYWFLAQTPGPNVVQGSSMTSLSVNNSTVEPSSSSWDESWSGWWDPLSSDADSSASSGLSTGAKAGIGVGCVIAGLLLISLIAWMLVCRRRRAATATAAEVMTAQYNQAPSLTIAEAPNTQGLQELHSERIIRELPSTPTVRHEMG